MYESAPEVEDGVLFQNGDDQDDNQERLEEMFECLNVNISSIHNTLKQLSYITEKKMVTLTKNSNFIHTVLNHTRLFLLISFPVLLIVIWELVKAQARAY